MTAEKLDSSKRTWLATAVGLGVGIVSLFAAQTIDSALNARMPDLGAFLGHYILAGATFSVAFSPTVRAVLPERGTRLGAGWSALQSSTKGFFLFLVPTLVTTPDSTGRWLPYFYAASILIAWVAYLGLLQNQLPTSPPTRLLNETGETLPFPLRKGPGVRSARVTSNRPATAPPARQLPPGADQEAAVQARRLTNCDHLPYALFVAVALLLLLLGAICSVADQRSATIQLANWAYGFLLIAVSIASLCLLLDRSIAGERLGRLSRFALPIAALAFFPLASFVDANSHSRAESLVITDVYPNFLAQQQRPGDILISDSPSLRLNTIPRIATSVNINPDERGRALWDDLTHALDAQQRVLWITVPGQSRDMRGGLAAFLRANGCLDYVSNTSLPVQVYELNKPLALPHVLSPFWAAQTADALDPVLVNFGPIQLTGQRFERRACSHDSVAVAMRWQLNAKTSPLKMSLFLSDAKGRRIQMQDFDITDTSQRQMDQRQQEAAFPAYYLLNVPLGTPPGSYKLGLGVYPVSQPQWLRVGYAEGAENHFDHIELGTVEVYRAQDVSADPWNSRQDSALLPANDAMANGLVLDGYEVTDPTIVPGESLHLALRWHAVKDGLPSYVTKVSLRQGDGAIAEESGMPVDGAYPTDEWRSGEYVTEHKDLKVPGDITGGLAQLEVSVAGGKATYLADIDIESIARTFQLPTMGHSANVTFKSIGELVGYDLGKTPLAPDQPFELKLYWRAGASVGKDYTVFAQLLAADGHLIAQSDSQPARGRRPTRSWLPGEIVSDQHTLDFKDQSYQGEAKLIVGFYDAETGERVPVAGGADNFFVLPARVQVVAK